MENSANSAKSLLILIIPFALAIILLVTAWPLMIAAVCMAIAWKAWQQYYWLQFSHTVTPYFRELVEENQGRITIADLAMRANLDGNAAQWFLNRKAKEYGAQQQIYEGRGIIYYFLTSKALENMFEDSEPDFAIEEMVDQDYSGAAFVHDIAQLVEIESETFNYRLSATPPHRLLSPTRTVTIDADLATHQETEIKNSGSINAIAKLLTIPTETTKKGEKISPLIQAELAKRLKVHASTIAKQKTKPNFATWSQNRDPDGKAWQYLPKKKLFIVQVSPIEN